MKIGNVFKNAASKIRGAFTKTAPKATAVNPATTTAANNLGAAKAAEAAAKTARNQQAFKTKVNEHISKKVAAATAGHEASITAITEAHTVALHAAKNSAYKRAAMVVGGGGILVGGGTLGYRAYAKAQTGKPTALKGIHAASPGKGKARKK